MLRILLTLGLATTIHAQQYSYKDPVTCQVNTCSGSDYSWLDGIVDTNDASVFNYSAGCVYAAWQDATACSVACGGGTKSQNRTRSSGDTSLCTELTQDVACGSQTCEDYCSAQSACAAGQYRSGCGASGPGSCTLCASCPAGQERVGCGGLDAGSCQESSSCPAGQVEAHKDGATECITDTYTEVTVSAGVTSSPYYVFKIAGTPVTSLSRGETYRFVRDGAATSHPFWIAGAHASDAGISVGHGIQGSEWLQVTLDANLPANSLSWLCTVHTYMAGVFDVLCPSGHFNRQGVCTACRTCPAGSTLTRCSTTSAGVCRRDGKSGDDASHKERNAAKFVTKAAANADVTALRDRLAAIANERNAVSGAASAADKRKRVDASVLSALSSVSEKVLRRMMVAETSSGLDADKEDVELVVSKDAFSSRSNLNAQLNSDSIADVILKPVKVKTAESCDQADVHIDEIAAGDFVEVILLEQGDVSIKCLDASLATKVVLKTENDDASDDVYEAFCHDGSSWVSQGDMGPDTSYTCPGTGDYKHWIASDGSGAQTQAAACPKDLTGDGKVNAGDLSVVLGDFGDCASGDCPKDLTGDSKVNAGDLSVILGDFGDCP